MNTREQFNAAYLASLPVAVQLVMHTTTAGTLERKDAIAALMEEGVVIERQTMINGTDPFLTMYAFHVFGYTWVMNAKQDSTKRLYDGVPGYTNEGGVPYNPFNPPADTIKVPDPEKCDLAVWYPPVVKPIPPVVVMEPVGPFVGAPWPEMATAAGKTAFRALPGAEKLPDGKEVTENGVVYVKHTFFTFATIMYYFTKN